MEIRRELLAEVGIGLGAITLFIAIVYAIGQAYATNGDLAPEGGFAILGALGLFIVLLLIAGLWLERQDFDS